MSKVSKVYWVSDFDLEDINKNLEGDIELAKKCDIVHRNKITISYEIDREVTIKESDIDRLCDGVAFYIKDISIIKKKLFGGGENE